MAQVHNMVPSSTGIPIDAMIGLIVATLVLAFCHPIPAQAIGELSATEVVQPK